MARFELEEADVLAILWPESSIAGCIFAGLYRPNCASKSSASRASKCGKSNVAAFAPAVVCINEGKIERNLSLDLAHPEMPAVIFIDWRPCGNAHAMLAARHNNINGVIKLLRRKACGMLSRICFARVYRWHRHANARRRGSDSIGFFIA